MGSGLIVLGSLGTSAQLIVRASEQVSQLDAALGEAIRDSAQAAERMQAWLQQEGQRDSIAARLALIEEIDARRYDWPHLLEEIAVAVPEGVWITRIANVPSGRPRIRFRVEGKALDNFILTRFWNALETSFFIRDVELLSTEHLVAQDPETDYGARTSYHFVLEADRADPPQEILNFVPFAGSGT